MTLGRGRRFSDRFKLFSGICQRIMSGRVKSM